MSLQIKDNSVDISASILWETVQATFVLTKEVSKLQFKVLKVPGSTIPVVNDQIDVYENGNHIFGGTVTEVTMTIEGGVLLAFQIQCVDWSYQMDGKLVVKNYAAMDPHDIVVDILNTFAAGKGFTTNHVQTGHFLVPSIKFNYEQPTKAIEALAKLIGWEWYVDPDKDVHFFIAENIPAPFNLDDTSGNMEWPNLSVDINLQNMKNSVFVIGGTYLKNFTSTSTPDVYQTDGVKQVFSLAYPYERSSITITLAGVSQTIGIDQQTDPATVQILYNEFGRFIRFTGGAPSSGQTVKIYGNARIPILAHASDSQGINSYGEFQDSVFDKHITTVAEAQQRAKAEILQFGHAVYDVIFYTLQTGLKIGQNIQLNSSKFGVNANLIIKRIIGTSYTPNQMRYEVEALGSDNVTFTDIMATLLQQQNVQNPVDSSTVLETLLAQDETIAVVESITVTPSSGPYKWQPDGAPAMRWNFFTWA